MSEGECLVQSSTLPQMSNNLLLQILPVINHMYLAHVFPECDISYIQSWIISSFQIVTTLVWAVSEVCRNYNVQQNNLTTQVCSASCSASVIGPSDVDTLEVRRNHCHQHIYYTSNCFKEKLWLLFILWRIINFRKDTHKLCMWCTQCHSWRWTTEEHSKIYKSADQGLTIPVR